MSKKETKKVYVVVYELYDRYQEYGLPCTSVVRVFNNLCDALAYVSTKAGSVTQRLEYDNPEGTGAILKSIWETEEHTRDDVDYYYRIEEFDLS